MSRWDKLDSLHKYAGETLNSLKEKIPPVDTDNIVGKAKSIKNLVVFHVSLGYNLVNHDAENQPWWDRITDKVVLGALPFHDRNHRQKLIEKENIGSSSDFMPGY